MLARNITIADLSEKRIRNAVRGGITGGRINASAEKYQYNSDENKNVNNDSDGGSGGSLAVAKRTLERNLADLQKKGILCRTGNTSAGRWMLLKESK